MDMIPEHRNKSDTQRKHGRINNPNTHISFEGTYLCHPFNEKVSDKGGDKGPYEHGKGVGFYIKNPFHKEITYGHSADHGMGKGISQKSHSP